MPNHPILNVINESHKVIGQDTRANIHKKGLLHKEIHVFFHTPGDHIIFQLRAKNKETFPDLLDATAGGHVEIGQTDLTAACQEILEETGLKVQPNQLKLLKTIRDKAHDPVTNTTNNVIRPVYFFQFKGKVADLTVEPGQGQGFESWPIKLLLNLSPSQKNHFVPTIINRTYLDLYSLISHDF